MRLEAKKVSVVYLKKKMEQSHIIFISFARNQQDVKSPGDCYKCTMYIRFSFASLLLLFISPPHYPFVPVFYDVILIGGGNTKGKFQVLLGVATNCFFTLLQFYFIFILFFLFFVFWLLFGISESLHQIIFILFYNYFIIIFF